MQFAASVCPQLPTLFRNENNTRENRDWAKMESGGPSFLSVVLQEPRPRQLTGSACLDREG